MPKARRRTEKEEGAPANKIRDGWRERGREDGERTTEEENEGGGESRRADMGQRRGERGEMR